MTIQEILTNRVIELKSRNPRKGDFLVDELSHKWYYDGEFWNDIGTLSLQTLVSGYGVKIQDGIVSINDNIVALKTDVLDATMTINNIIDVNKISFSGLTVVQDQEDLNKVIVSINSNAFVEENDLSTVAFSGDYNDLINKPGNYVLPIATSNLLGGVKPDNSTITVDIYGNISVPHASEANYGLVKLGSSREMGNSSELVPTEAAVRQAMTEVDSHSSYLYVAYADDINGTNWSLNPLKVQVSVGQVLKTQNFRKYRAEIISENPITTLTSSDFANADWVKFVGDDVYLYIAYASDDQGSNFTTTPSRAVKYAAFLVSYTKIESANLQQAFTDQQVTWVKYIGDNSYVYIAYASDNQGTNWSLTPTNSLKYRAELISDAEIPNPTSTHFAGCTWMKYLGDDAYIYTAYAEDNQGTGFSLIPSFNKKYIAVLVTYTEIQTPTISDFTGVIWTRYIGIDTYTYIAYASDNQGSNFSLIPSDSLKYRAEIHTNTAIDTLTSSDFSGATWVKYIGDNSYPRYAYAEDENGTGFSLTPDFTRKYIAQVVLYTDRAATSSDFTGAIWVKYIGNNCYVYFAYASDDQGSNFSITESSSLGYINYITSYVPLSSFTLSMFNQRVWVRYIGVDCYTYVAYASDSSGANWSTTPSLELKYRAEIHRTTPIATLTSNDFLSATWVKYIGIDTYTYVGYASDATGSNFSLTPNSSLPYRKEIHSEVILNPPVFSDFGSTGWVQIIPQISIGTVVSGAEAVVTNVGTGLNPVLNITLPRGQDGIGIIPQGEYDNSITYVLNDVVRFGKYLWRCKVTSSQGVQPPSVSGVTSNTNWDIWLEDGQTPTISIGTVSVAPGNTPNVTNSGTSTSMVLDFELVPGQAATVSVGTVTTGNPGSNVIVTNSGTSYAAVLDITIPRGDNGYYFTPSVASNGDISWTNNGGLSNPSTVNIKGPQGVSYYLYVAYAEDDQGTGWSETPNNLRPYRAEIVSNVPISNLSSSDFAGARWVKYIGNSAYEIWLSNGNVGTESDFLSWLRQQSASISFTNSDLDINNVVTKIVSNAVVAIVDNDGYQWKIPDGDIRYIGANVAINLSGIMAMKNITSLSGTWKIMLSGGLDGSTPVIGNNGNWFIGSTDTGKKATGTGSNVILSISQPTSSELYDGVIWCKVEDANDQTYMNVTRLSIVQSTTQPTTPENGMIWIQ